MKTTARIFILLTALSLLSACGALLSKDPLADSAWVLVQIEGSPVMTLSKPILAFKEGRLGGSTGCNSYGGEYRVRGDSLQVEAIAMTMMACMDEGVMELEQEFTSILNEAQNFTISGSQLQITDSNGRSLSFSRMENWNLPD